MMALMGATRPFSAYARILTGVLLGPLYSSMSASIPGL